MSDQTVEKNQQAVEEVSQDGQQLEACRIELDQIRDQLMRERADFENHKKRTERERGQWIRSGQAPLLSGLLDIVDHFDRALAEAEKKDHNAHAEMWQQGFEMIRKELNKYLQAHGVEQMPFESTFNPERHEALMSVESADHQSGEVVAILQKGYLFKGEVLRPAKVSVAK